jgi:hypothetical protein
MGLQPPVISAAVLGFCVAQEPMPGRDPLLRHWTGGQVMAKVA